MKIKSIHHVKLTVSDLSRSKAFYEQLPGFKLVAEYPDFIMFGAGDMNIGLTTHQAKRASERFDEFSVGLDHLAFRVVGETGLVEAVDFLDTQKINRSEVKTLSNGVQIVTFRDPDNIQLEFAWKA
ncbi:MAG TPA: VOC family protein [Candidatus Saccharimonadales bacterium]|nr:VOC family protein [Candidatus Saccharimonadales bacterium]